VTTIMPDGPPRAEPDVLAGLPGVVVRVLLTPDGRAGEITGLEPAFHPETGHFFASVGMVLDTLAGIWSDIVGRGAAPLRSWVARSGEYWLAGSGRRAWVLDPSEADIAAVLRRLEPV
jgi:roadblock/LC7 domain-containing protein